MVKKLAVVLLVIFIAAFAFAGSGREAKEKALDEMTVGVVLPYFEGWFNYWNIGWNVVMNEYGIETQVVLTSWEPEREIQAVRDFVAKGVDAITITSGNPDAAQTCCQIANDGGVPIQICDTKVADGPGEPFSDVEFDWYNIGEKFGQNIARIWPGSKVVEMQGLAGFGPVELQKEGLRDFVAKEGGIELVHLEHINDYGIETTLNTMRDIIQGGLDFDVVIGGAQEQTQGTIEALKAAGKLDEVVVVSGNGGPLDEENFAEGELEACISQPPGFHAMVAATVMIEFLKGNEPPELTYTPTVWCMQDDWQETVIPWEVDESWVPVVENFIKTGKLEY
jgi:ribose transport system substrate-binding protein